MQVDQARNQLLPSPALTLDQDRDIGPGELLHPLPEVSHRLRLPENHLLWG